MIVLIPSLATFFMVMILKRAVPALLIGIITSLIILNIYFNKPILESAKEHLLSSFISDSVINWQNIFIICFLWLLGTFICILNNTGCIDAISNLMDKYIKTKRQAKLFTFFLGVIFFIDDYFNSLAIGTTARKLFDKKGLSRERLAYYLDSTAAPVCILVPISSWGAVIINILDNTLDNLRINIFNNGLELFVESIWYNFYSLITLAILFIVSIYNVDFPAMFKSDYTLRGSMDISNKNISLKTDIDFKKACISFTCIISLFCSSIFFMLLTGYCSMSGCTISWINILGNIKLGLSLFLGGCFSLIVFILLNPVKISTILSNSVEGIKIMSSAIKILILAWVFSFSMSELKVGTFVASIMSSDLIDIKYIPLASFTIAAFMSLMTGTSWVTFSILLPIVCEIGQVHDLSTIKISIGAVLAGAVFGDHCSPISDTSILSSTGAGCNHMNHISTQMPYCLVAAFISFISYYIICLGAK